MTGEGRPAPPFALCLPAAAAAAAMRCASPGAKRVPFDLASRRRQQQRFQLQKSQWAPSCQHLLVVRPPLPRRAPQGQEHPPSSFRPRVGSSLPTAVRRIKGQRSKEQSESMVNSSCCIRTYTPPRTHNTIRRVLQHSHK